MTYGKELREFTVIAELGGQRTRVCVNGWDVAGKSALQHEATESAISSELNGDTSGASILQAALGDRKEALAHTVPHEQPRSSDEGGIVIPDDGAALRGRQGSGRGQKPTAVGGTTRSGLGPLFSGKYYLAEVRHVFDGERSPHRVHRRARRARQAAITSKGTEMFEVSTVDQIIDSRLPAGSAADGTAFTRRWSAISRIPTARDG